MKVLVGILAHHLQSEVVRRVHSLAWDGSFDVLTSWGDDIRPGESRFDAVTRKYQDMQRTFLGGPWDCLLTVEQDMYIPPHTLVHLARLIRDGADVAYGLYVWRYTEQHWWSAHPRLADVDGELNFWSLTHQPDEARRLWGQPVVVEGLGMGCTLMSRHVLTRIPFRQRAKNHCNDTAFALDCKDEGMIQIADLGVVCGHGLSSGGIVWPDPNAPDLYRITQE